MGGGHDEREQTLNQLLVEMDGFDVKGGVILIAATNRPDILDPALLRPGRFDRQIAVGPPDVIGREAVLKVHAKGKPFAADVDLGVIARRTPGFTGADLANVINEAALLTARNNGRLITGQALEESIDRVIAGPERKTRAMSDKEKRVTAYHEAGHALTAWAMPNLDPVHKVTILPRGRSLGHTLVLPLEDRYTQTRAEILDQLVYALGGRAAEELVFHEPTTGASNDIEKATKLARAMVTEYGMSAKLGAVKYGTGDAEPFMGRDYGNQRDYSEDIAADIDAEVRDLIEGAHDEAWEILQQYRDALDAMVLELVEKETLAKDDLERILAPGAQAPAAQHVHRLRQAHAQRPAADRDPAVAAQAGRERRVDERRARQRQRQGAARRRPRADRAAAAAELAVRRTRPAAAQVERRRRRPAPVDFARAEAAVRELLIAVGEDPDRDGLKATPARVARVLRRDLRRPARRPRRRPGDDLRRAPRRARAGQGHPAVLDLRAPPRAVARHRPRSATSRASTGASPGCPSWPGSSTSTPAARRCRSGSPARSPTRWSRRLEPRGRHRRHRGRAPVHGDARGPQARRPDDDLGRARHVQGRPAYPRRGARPDPGPLMTGGVQGVPARADRICVVGVLNVTPDSFSDGGRYTTSTTRSRTAWRCTRPGADLVDIGGESTRPGAQRVAGRGGAAPDHARSIEGLAAHGVPLSVDTYRAAVAEQALAAGVTVVNDVSGGLADPAMAAVVRDAGCPWILMHWRGHSDTMQRLAVYDDVVADVRARAARARRRRGRRRRRRRRSWSSTPASGFAKTGAHNWALLAAPADLRRARACRCCVAASRKSFLGTLLAGARRHAPRPVDEREDATTAITAHCAAAGVWGVRVHDVRPSVDAALAVAAIQGAS